MYSEANEEKPSLKNRATASTEQESPQNNSGVTHWTLST